MIIDEMYVIVLTGSRGSRRELRIALTSVDLAKVACFLLNRTLSHKDRYLKRREYRFERRRFDSRCDHSDAIDADGRPLHHWPGARDPRRPALSPEEVARILATIQEP